MILRALISKARQSECTSFIVGITHFIHTVEREAPAAFRIDRELCIDLDQNLRGLLLQMRAIHALLHIVPRAIPVLSSAPEAPRREEYKEASQYMQMPVRRLLKGKRRCARSVFSTRIVANTSMEERSFVLSLSDTQSPAHRHLDC